MTRKLDAFESGYLKDAVNIWDALEQRDDLIRTVVSKRKKAVGPASLNLVRAALIRSRDGRATHSNSDGSPGGLANVPLSGRRTQPVATVNFQGFIHRFGSIGQSHSPGNRRSSQAGSRDMSRCRGFPTEPPLVSRIAFVANLCGQRRQRLLRRKALCEAALGIERDASGSHLMRVQVKAGEQRLQSGFSRFFGLEREAMQVDPLLYSMIRGRTVVVIDRGVAALRHQ
jgi:hypothetical protein